MTKQAPHKAGDMYRVTIAGRTYTELPVTVFPNGNVILDIFGAKYFTPEQYQKVGNMIDGSKYIEETEDEILMPYSSSIERKD